MFCIALHPLQNCIDQMQNAKAFSNWNSILFCEKMVFGCFNIGHRKRWAIDRKRKRRRRKRRERERWNYITPFCFAFICSITILIHLQIDEMRVERKINFLFESHQKKERRDWLGAVNWMERNMFLSQTHFDILIMNAKCCCLFNIFNCSGFDNQQDINWLSYATHTQTQYIEYNNVIQFNMCIMCFSDFHLVNVCATSIV